MPKFQFESGCLVLFSKELCIVAGGGACGQGQGAQGLESKGREQGTADLHNHGKSIVVEVTSGDPQSTYLLKTCNYSRFLRAESSPTFHNSNYGD